MPQKNKFIYVFCLDFISIYFIIVRSVVREVLQKYGPDLRMQGASIECLRESSEYYLTQLFEDASWACMHRGRVTLGAVDMKLILIIRGETDPGRR